MRFLHCYILQPLDFLRRQAGNRHDFLHLVALVFHPAGGLHESLVSGGFLDDHLVLLPLIPIHFVQIRATCSRNG